MNNDSKHIERGLAAVRLVIRGCLKSTAIGLMAEELAGIVGTGKMLRGRLVFRIGSVMGLPSKTIAECAAAVELFHAASLLHDDVIDGAVLRRGVPAFWVAKGSSGAVLLGDVLVCQGFRLVNGVESGRLTDTVIGLVGEMCEAEAEQELLLRGATPNWAKCVSIARRKTGSLFALAGYVSGGKDEGLCSALKNAGYAVGTAYQLADDIFDAHGDPDVAGKTLGNDAAAGKITAASSWRISDVVPQACIGELISDSEKQLLPYPVAAGAWREYLQSDLLPVIDKFLKPFSAVSGSDFVQKQG